jgi:hypothetical protein
VTWLREIHGYFNDAPRQLTGARVLRIAFGSMLLLRMGTELRFASYLWGAHGIGDGSTVFYLGDQFGKLVDHALFETAAGPTAVCLVLALAGLGLVLDVRPLLSTFVALAAFWLLELRTPAILDGGDNITRLTLMYMLLLSPDGRGAKPGSLRTWFHNLGVLAVALQLCMLYLTSGFMKATGERWQHGTAMYLISQVETFSLPAARAIFHDPIAATLASYVPMLFQLWFPIAMLSRVKLLWLAIGIGFHLGVATFMGLIAFSTVMIGLELFLITDAEYAMLRRWTATALERARPLAQRLRVIGAAWPRRRDAER